MFYKCSVPEESSFCIFVNGVCGFFYFLLGWVMGVYVRLG